MKRTTNDIQADVVAATAALYKEIDEIVEERRKLDIRWKEASDAYKNRTTELSDEKIALELE